MNRSRISMVFLALIFSTVELMHPPQRSLEKDFKSDNDTREHKGPDDQKSIVINVANSGKMQQSKAISSIATNNKTIVTGTPSNRSGPSNVEVAPKITENLVEKTSEIESGAIERAILVFLGVGFFFILYVGLQTYRRKRQDKSRTMIRKYGVRTNRADLEMEPLPLSDDDEDDTIFDLNASRNVHH